MIGIKITRSRIWEVLEHGKETKHPSRLFNIFIIALIIANVVLNILGTIQRFEMRYSAFLRYFELTSVIIFTVEYSMRMWACTADPKYPNSFLGRVKFFFTPMALIDLVAIFPFYISLGGTNLIELRLFRIFRLAKVGRYCSSLKIIKNVFINKKEELILSAFIMFFILIMISSLMYYAENSAQPEKFSSIPATMILITSMTVGYGDIWPATMLGKFIAACNAVIGIGMFALPTAIIGAGLVEEIEKKKKKTSHICPHCNKLIE